MVVNKLIKPINALETQNVDDLCETLFISLKYSILNIIKNNNLETLLDLDLLIPCLLLWINSTDITIRKDVIEIISY